MRFVVRLLYEAAAKLAGYASGVVPPSATKTAIAIRARHGIRDRYRKWASIMRDESRPLLWMHAPSVGEGLQARPVLTLMRARHPEAQLAYTFFSPSAEEFSRTLDVDFRDYLPFDSSAEMAAALDALKPRALVFSKLDVWPELVRQAKRRGVRLGMISATLAAASGRRSFGGNLLLGDSYSQLDAVGAVDGADAERLKELGVRPDVITVTGDTRFDQVWQRAQDRSSGLVARLTSDRPTIVAGSTWPPDEVPLLAAMEHVREQVPKLRLIIAPHEMTPDHIAPIEYWAKRENFSIARVDHMDAATSDVVLVDRFGVLGDLYALASVAFVGGGFHAAGLHSVLEPAAYGAPVLFGPQYSKSRDASLLLGAGGAASVQDSFALERKLLEWLTNDSARRTAGANAARLIEKGKGAADRSLAIVERLMAGA